MKRLAMISLLAILCFSFAGSVFTQSVADIHQAILAEDDQKTKNISTEELRKIITSKSAIVFDVRPFQEYSIDHIPTAVHIGPKPGTMIDQYTADITEIGRAVQGNKSAPIVVYCNGPYCGKSKRVANELVAAGYKNVRRYQLGIPVWRALGHATVTELEGVRYVMSYDNTAVLIDARDQDIFMAGTLPKARNIPASHVESDKGGPEVKHAKKDGRLPMENHNIRIIVFGREGAQAEHVAQVLGRNAFHNVSYFPDTFEQLQAALE